MIPGGRSAFLHGASSAHSPRPGLQFHQLILGTDRRFSLMDGCAPSSFSSYSHTHSCILLPLESSSGCGGARREETLLNPKPARFSPLLLPRATHCSNLTSRHHGAPPLLPFTQPVRQNTPLQPYAYGVTLKPRCTVLT